MTGRLLYFAVYILGSGLGLVKMLAVAEELTPASFGLYSLAVITAGLLFYVNSMGVADAFLVRLNPANTDNDRRARFRDSALLFTFAMAVLTGCFVAGLYFLIERPEGAVPAMLVVVVFLAMQSLFNLLMVQVQAQAQSNLYAWLLTAKSLVPILVILIWELGDDPTMFLLLDAAVLTMLSLLCLAHSGFPAASRFSGSDLALLMRQGAPFTGQAAVQNLGLNADKWAIGLGAGAAQLGVYNLAAQLIVCGMAFASMMQVYFLPQVMRRSIDHAGRGEVMREVVGISALALAISSILFAGCALLAFSVVQTLYPGYARALDLVPIMAVAGVIISSNHAELYFRAYSLGTLYLSIQLVTLVMLLALYGAMIAIRAPLWSYAAAFAAVRAAQAAAAFTIARRHAANPETS